MISREVFNCRAFFVIMPVMRRGLHCITSSRCASSIFIVAVVGLYSIGAINRAHTWEDNHSLVTDTAGKSPNKARLHYALGVIYHMEGRLDEASEKYKTALRIKPDYAEACNNLGSVYYERGQYEKAIEFYALALKINPNLANPHSNIGSIYYEQGLFKEALYEYIIAEKIEPSSAVHHYNTGLAYSKLNLIDKAVEEYKTAIKLKPDYEDARNALMLSSNP